jgi:hypothetical protein
MAVSQRRSFNLFSVSLLTVVASQPSVRPVNHRVMATTTTDVISSENKWRIILDIDLQAFHHHHHLFIFRRSLFGNSMPLDVVIVIYIIKKNCETAIIVSKQYVTYIIIH